ncbi:tetratricopeptide repeat protein [Lysobacter sp. TAF61]|uniref:tetratricopeptide repeat protein n=1 Tax=Lysobacter sp. TAF61 TaxID=3233072 RepID=UPI003F985E7C
MTAWLLMAPLAGAFATGLDPVISRAEQGDASVQHELCYQFLYGEGGRQKNFELAFRWCSAAAAAGQSSSQTLLAEMYYLGLHVEKNEGMAKEYYLVAAEQGHPHAQLMLGRLALHNSDVVDPYQFCYWTRAAAARNYGKAIEQLQSVEDQWRKQQKPGAAGYCDSVMAKQSHTQASQPAPTDAGEVSRTSCPLEVDRNGCGRRPNNSFKPKPLRGSA